MNWQDTPVVLTGASRGIGRCLALRLGAARARIALVSRGAEELRRLAAEIESAGGQATPVVADLSNTQGCREACEELASFGDVEVLINNAGASWFGQFVDRDPEALERDMSLNALAPMTMTRLLLPAMLRRGSGQIVNVGSTFGAIGFAHFVSYSAAKFALRGFTEALRRELAGTGVDLTYFAPRATKTAQMSSYEDMARELGMNVDEPDWVAAKLMHAIEKRAPEVQLGIPESIFARLNAVLPRVVDRGVRSQDRRAAAFTLKPEGSPA